MKASFLQLESSAFTSVRIDVNKNFPIEHAQNVFDDYGGAGYTSFVELAADDTIPGRHYVKLEVRLPGTESVQPPYTLHLEIIGVFVCNSPGEEVGRFVEVNGPAVLYGSVREMVTLVTSRGPFPPMVLPIVNFIPPGIEVDAEGRQIQAPT